MALKMKGEIVANKLDSIMRLEGPGSVESIRQMAGVPTYGDLTEVQAADVHKVLVERGYLSKDEPSPGEEPQLLAPGILKAAAQHMQDRADQRDQPDGERSMARCVEAFNALTGHNLDETEGWLFMAVLKASRACANNSTPNRDDYEDGAAYFALAGESALRLG